MIEMKAYEHITCDEMLEVIKEVFDVSNTQAKHREYVVSVSVCGVPLRIHVYKNHPKDWRVTGFDPVGGNGWDEMLMAVHAINDELDMRYY